MCQIKPDETGDVLILLSSTHTHICDPERRRGVIFNLDFVTTLPFLIWIFSSTYGPSLNRRSHVCTSLLNWITKEAGLGGTFAIFLWFHWANYDGLLKSCIKTESEIFLNNGEIWDHRLAWVAKSARALIILPSRSVIFFFFCLECLGEPSREYQTKAIRWFVQWHTLI